MEYWDYYIWQAILFLKENIVICFFVAFAILIWIIVIGELFIKITKCKPK
jgi:hypothetical protein